MILGTRNLDALNGVLNIPESLLRDRETALNHVIKIVIVRVGLTQLIRFLVVELTYSGLNPKFNMCVAFTANYVDVPVDSDTLLMIDFVNLKIKLTQSFRCAYRGRMCVHVFIRISDRMCMSICICTVILKNYY
jgi:hypothetical protein